MRKSWWPAAVALTFAAGSLAACGSATNLPVTEPSTPVTSVSTPEVSTTAAVPTTAAVATTTPVVPAPAVACAAPVDLGQVPSGKPLTFTADQGDITATLRGTKTGPDGASPQLGGPRLVVSSAGTTLFDVAVTPPAGANAVTPWPLSPVAVGSQTQSNAISPVCLARFSGASQPTVLVGLTIGGAHCCTVVRSMPATAAGNAASADTNLGNPGAVVQSDGDHAIVVTADNDFAYAFASYAGSGMPVKVLEVQNGRFVTTTRQHLDLVTRDAADWWKAATDPANTDDRLGLLAAWTADELLLGHPTDAWATLEQLNAKAGLQGPPEWKSGAAYIQSLRTFVAAHGYTS